MDPYLESKVSCEFCGSDRLYEVEGRDGGIEDVLCWKCDRGLIDDIEERQREREEE